MTVTAEMIDEFADITGDRFEIHMSGKAARRHGPDARVAHGPLVLSLIDGLRTGRLRSFAPGLRPAGAGASIGPSSPVTGLQRRSRFRQSRRRERKTRPSWCPTSMSPVNAARMRIRAQTGCWSVAERRQVSKSRTSTPSAPPSSSATIRAPMPWCSSSAR